MAAESGSDSKPTETETAAGLPADAIGARLQQARTRLGLSREKCGERLFLEKSVIEALENEQFHLLGAGVYARGHLRRYAELLGEDPHEFEQLMSRRAGAGGAPDLSSIVTQPITGTNTQARKIGVWPMAAIAAALVLAAVIRWAMNTKTTVATTEVTTVVAPAVNIAPPVAAMAPAAAAPSAAKATPPAAVGARSGAMAPTGMEATGVDAGAKGRVTVKFIGDGWLEVTDSAGKRLYAEQGKAGSAVPLEGVLPLHLVVGSVAAIAIELNGRRVQLPDNLPAGENQRLTLGANGKAALE